MPDKYEREIEDILRNLKNKETRPGLGPVPRRASAPRRLPGLGPDFATKCLLIAVIAGLVGGGWAYALGEGNVLTGLIALVGAVCIALVALSSFITKERPSSYPRR